MVACGADKFYKYSRTAIGPTCLTASSSGGRCKCLFYDIPTHSIAFVDPVTLPRLDGGIVRFAATRWYVESDTGGRAGEVCVDRDRKLVCRRISFAPALGRSVWAPFIGERDACLLDGESHLRFVGAASCMRGAGKGRNAIAHAAALRSGERRCVMNVLRCGSLRSIHSSSRVRKPHTYMQAGPIHCPPRCPPSSAVRAAHHARTDHVYAPAPSAAPPLVLAANLMVVVSQLVTVQSYFQLPTPFCGSNVGSCPHNGSLPSSTTSTRSTGVASLPSFSCTLISTPWNVTGPGSEASQAVCCRPVGGVTVTVSHGTNVFSGTHPGTR